MATILVGGCSSAAAPPAPVPTRPVTVAPAPFAAAVAEPGRLVVNVHVPFEGSIPGTDLDVPYDRIGEAVDRGAVPADRATPLAVYCRTGPMSAEAVRTLSARGYTDVVDLAGGMVAWVGSGRPLSPVPAPTS